MSDLKWLDRPVQSQRAASPLLRSFLTTELINSHFIIIEGMLNIRALRLDRIQTMLKFAPEYDRLIGRFALFTEAMRREAIRREGACPRSSQVPDACLQVAVLIIITNGESYSATINTFEVNYNYSSLSINGQIWKNHQPIVCLEYELATSIVLELGIRTDHCKI